MKIEINKEDLKGNRTDPWDCPLFRALKRLGYKVERVGVYDVTIDGEEYVVHSSYLESLFIAQTEGFDSVTLEVEGLKSLKPSLWERFKNIFK